MEKLSDRRVAHNDTKRAVLRLLRADGPMQRWQIYAALGKMCATSLTSLQKSGHIEMYKDDNRHPDPCSKYERIEAMYFSFVRDLDGPKGIADNRVNWAIRALRARGYRVEKLEGSE